MGVASGFRLATATSTTLLAKSQTASMRSPVSTHETKSLRKDDAVMFPWTWSRSEAVQGWPDGCVCLSTYTKSFMTGCWGGEGSYPGNGVSHVNSWTDVSLYS